MSHVEDTGPVVDPTHGLRAALEADEAEARLQHRPSSAFLRAWLQERCEALLARWAAEDEAAEE